jgi:hypothetical protein
MENQETLLRELVNEVKSIRKRIDNPRTMFRMGIWRGVGTILGAALILALAGFLIKIFGFIPLINKLLSFILSVR